MTGSFDIPADLLELLENVCEGTTTDAEKVRLNELLADDPQARQFYLTYMDLHGTLSWDTACIAKSAASEGSATQQREPIVVPDADEAADELQADQPQEKDPILAGPVDLAISPEAAVDSSEEPSGLLSSTVRENVAGTARRPLYVSLTVAACAVVVGLCVMAIVHLPTSFRGVAEKEDSPSAAAPLIAALVAGTAECEWAKGSPVLEAGKVAPLGKRFELASGLVKLVFGHQARCVLEGPVVFRVISADAIRIESGRVAAEAPPRAVGFTVHTPWADAIDQGTAFGVGVDLGGPTSVHVFEGTVQVKPVVEGLSEMTITAGQAVELVSNGTTYATQTTGADRAAFRRQLPGGPGGGYAASQFDKSTEGWSVTMDGHSPAYLKSDVPGQDSYLETYDEWKRKRGRLKSEQIYFSFIAPSPFWGNHEKAYGKALAFDLRVRNGEREPKVRYCELHGADMVLGFPVQPPPTDDTWTHRVVPLRNDQRWVRLDLSGAPPARQDDLKAVLKDLRRVVVPGEFYFGEDIVGLDNVVLGAEETP